MYNLQLVYISIKYPFIKHIKTMKKILLIATGLALFNLGFAQQMDLPVTFDEAGIDYGVIGFEGAQASTIEADPTDATNTVVKVIKAANAMPWAGTTITNAAEEGLATPIPFDASNTKLSLRVWSPDAGIPVRLKVEDHLDPTHSVETEATVTSAMGWQTLEFNFANQAPGTAALNLSYSFDKASVFFNFGTDGATAGEKTYYFDDLQFVEGGGASEFNVTFSVDMNGVTGFTTPEVNGTFNNWCGGCAPMTDANNDGIWEITITLPEGAHEYKFAYDSWAGQENLTQGSACTVTNNDGFTNRSLMVSANTTLPTVCWGSCTACNTSSTYNVTFQVDMSLVEDPYTTPEVNGTFNSWCGGCAAMTDENNDGIWEITIPLEAGEYEFKYAADSWAIQEEFTPGGACTVTNNGFTNRQLTVDGDVVLPVTCWASCSACASGGMATVVFQVDMNNVVGPFTTPEVNGTFNNWCGGCAPMSDANSDGIWELAIELAPGTYEYKFAYDSWAGQETLIPGSSCVITTDGFTNRLLNVTTSETLPVVCWGSCSDCNTNEGPFNITFKVDMNEVTAAFTTPEINGTFNNWCGGCAPMTDANNDGIWEITIPIAADTIEYKFAYDSWAGQEELTPGSACTSTIDGFTNRSFIVSQDTVLGVVCWAKCTPCIVGFENAPAAADVKVYPNPANETVNIAINGLSKQPIAVSVNDAAGRLVSTNTYNATNNISLETHSLTNGVYFIQITTENGVITKPVFVSH